MLTYIEMTDLWNKDPDAVYAATSTMPEDGPGYCPKPEHFPDAVTRAQPPMHGGQLPSPIAHRSSQVGLLGATGLSGVGAFGAAAGAMPMMGVLSSLGGGIRHGMF